MNKKIINLSTYYPEKDVESSIDEYEELCRHEQFITSLLKSDPILFSYYNLRDVSDFSVKIKQVIFFAYNEINFSNILSGKLKSITFKVNKENSIIMSIEYKHMKNVTNIIGLRKLYSPLNITLSLGSEQNCVNILFKADFFDDFKTIESAYTKTKNQNKTLEV